jgi:hypothetical protein
VMWLCPLHHAERHRELESIKAVPLDSFDGKAGANPPPLVPATPITGAA